MVAASPSMLSGMNRYGSKMSGFLYRSGSRMTTFCGIATRFPAGTWEPSEKVKGLRAFRWVVSPSSTFNLDDSLRKQSIRWSLSYGFSVFVLKTLRISSRSDSMYSLCSQRSIIAQQVVICIWCIEAKSRATICWTIRLGFSWAGVVEDEITHSTPSSFKRFSARLWFDM